MIWLAMSRQLRLASGADRFANIFALRKESACAQHALFAHCARLLLPNLSLKTFMIRINRHQLLSVAAALSMALTSTVARASEELSSNSTGNSDSRASEERPGNSTGTGDSLAELELRLLNELPNPLADDFQDFRTSRLAGKKSDRIADSFFNSAKGKNDAKAIYKLADKFFDQRSDISIELAKDFCNRLEDNKGDLKKSVKNQLSKICDNIKKLGEAHDFSRRPVVVVVPAARSSAVRWWSGSSDFGLGAAAFAVVVRYVPTVFRNVRRRNSSHVFFGPASKLGQNRAH